MMHFSFNSLRSVPTGYVALPFFSSGVSAGFPQETPSLPEEFINVPSSLVEHPESTFVVVVCGDSMVGAGLDCGDHILVDTSRLPENGDVVAATVNGEQLVKYFERSRSGVVTLIPANPRYAPLEIAENDHFIVQGVVVQVVKQVRRQRSVLRPLGSDIVRLPLQKRESRVAPFASLVVNALHTDPLLAILHRLLSDKKGKKAGLVILAAIEMNLLERPTFRQLKDEFPTIGCKSSFSGSLDRRYFSPIELTQKENYKKQIAEALGL